jgi:hypothetical protein
LQGKCITCLPRPKKVEIGKPPWCCPRHAEFWRLCCTGWCAAYIMEIGAAAGSRTRICALAQRHSPLESQPRKLRSPGAQRRSGALPFQQRTNTSCYLAIPTHGFTVVLSVFWGTPPAKPLECKIRPNSSGALSRDLWADPTGGEPRLSRAFLCFVPGDIV